MGKEEKIIMYDSSEAATYETNIEGWVSANRHFYGKGELGERCARQDGYTHKKCECGNVFDKKWAYTVCSDCRRKNSYQSFLKLPYKEWDGIEPVCEYDGDKFFWGLDSLIDYMEENEMEEIDLYICEPIHYQTIDIETVASDCHEDWEPTADLERKIEEFNAFLNALPPHSYTSSKVRTSYKLTP